MDSRKAAVTITVQTAVAMSDRTAWPAGQQHCPFGVRLLKEDYCFVFSWQAYYKEFQLHHGCCQQMTYVNEFNNKLLTISSLKSECNLYVEQVKFVNSYHCY